MSVYGYIWIPAQAAEAEEAPARESALFRNGRQGDCNQGQGSCDQGQRDRDQGQRDCDQRQCDRDRGQRDQKQGSQKLRALTLRQREEKQREEMHNCGVSDAHIYVDTTESRASYHAMLKTLKRGDRVVLPELESLGATMQQILEQWQFLTEKKAVHLTILDMPGLCTVTGRGALDSLVAEIMTDTLSYLLQKQKKLRHEQQVKGIQAAKSRGVRCGRAPREIPEGFDAVFAKWEIGAISVNQAAKTLGVANKTFKKWAEAGANTAT